ncbi:MAG: alpha/beta fold hydrolase [Hyphomicrobiales bacterium]
MPHLATDDAVKLHYEEAGSGFPIVFVHEFAGDLRSWEPQLRYFSRTYRCIAFNARGYPPSDVPEDPGMYSYLRATADIVAIMRGLRIDLAHIVGLSMGAYATLNLGMRHPGLVRSLVVAGCGYGAEPARQAAFVQQSGVTAELFESRGSAVAAETYANVPARLSYLKKDPRGWAEFLDRLKGHSAVGATLTLRGVQMRRPSLWDLVEDMRKIEAPTLIVTGDDDDPCLEPGLLMKRSIPGAGLLVLPRGGHAINLEEPEAFNRALAEFFLAVEQERWFLE